jgi:Ca-activated chloride channel homolog
MKSQMKTLSLLALLLGILAIGAASQSVPASAGSPTGAAPAASPAAPPSFSSPVVAPKKVEATKPADDDADAIATFRKRVDEVNVIFTVTDKHGHFIKDLKKDDIRVLDDHKPPSSVVEFRSETDLPLRVGLLVDASNSIRDRFRFEQEAAMYFLSQVVRPKSDEAFVLGFDTTAEITQDFTDNAEKLSHGVRMLRPGGGTAMYDAIYYACRDKLMKARTNGPVRRAIILVSDGEDNQSRVTLGETIEMAQRAEVILYAISTNISNIKMRGDKIMERMAEATGGRAFFPFKIEDVSNAFAEIQDELRSQYAVAYKPADFQADGRYRSIDIASDNKKYHVRARKGYFAPTQ